MKKGERKKYKLASEELEITVKSLLPEDAELAIREIAPPGELPAPPRGLLYLLIILTAAIIIILVILALRQKRRKIAEEIAKKTAQEIAYEELNVLLARELRLLAGAIVGVLIGASMVLPAGPRTLG